MSDSKPEAATEEGFISRWSRRKQMSRAEVAEQAVDDVDVADAETVAVAAVEDESPDDSDMPPLESLDEESDYSGFMSPRVSDELRNLALRKLFLSGMFNQRDGLDDYDDDFTSFEKLGDVITAEMRHQMERLKNAIDDDVSEEMAANDIAASSAGAVEAAEQAEQAEQAGETDGVAEMIQEKAAGHQQGEQVDNNRARQNIGKQHEREGNVGTVK